MATQLEYDYTFKLCFAGNSGVGKSNLISHYLKKSFRSQPKSTIGLEFANKIVNIDNKSIRFQIWDTCGQEQFRSLIQAYCRGAVGIFLVFDIADFESFKSLESWYEQVRENAEENTRFIVLGNKCDLEATRQVSKKQGLKFAVDRKLKYIETSALELTNVELAFMTLFNEVLDANVREEGCEKRKNTHFEKNKTMISLTGEFNDIAKKNKSKCCM